MEPQASSVLRVKRVIRPPVNARVELSAATAPLKPEKLAGNRVCNVLQGKPAITASVLPYKAVVKLLFLARTHKVVSSRPERRAAQGALPTKYAAPPRAKWISNVPMVIFAMAMRLVISKLTRANPALLSNALEAKRVIKAADVFAPMIGTVTTTILAQAIYVTVHPDIVITRI